jgi:type I restriction enzyme S subunit
LGWLFTSPTFRKQAEGAMYGAGGQKRVPDSFVRDFAFAFPPIEEQSAIATFLDRETGKIDALIAEQEKLLKLLAEKRQATISHAVTRGLNPNAPMKASGMPWLGEIPAHWQLLPTKRLFRLIVDPAPVNNNEELLSIYTDIGVRPRKSLKAKGNKSTTTDGYWRVRKGDIIVNKLLAWMGAMGLSRYDGVTSPAYDILRKTRQLNPAYYDYLFRCGIMFSEFRRYSRGIMDMRLRLYFAEFGQITIPYPSDAEQTGIVDFLSNELMRFDGLKREAEHGIALLKERRSALIAAAVTGKIDVRQAA